MMYDSIREASCADSRLKSHSESDSRKGRCGGTQRNMHTKRETETERQSCYLTSKVFLHHGLQLLCKCCIAFERQHLHSINLSTKWEAYKQQNPSPPDVSLFTLSTSQFRLVFSVSLSLSALSFVSLYRPVLSWQAGDLCTRAGKRAACFHRVPQSSADREREESGNQHLCPDKYARTHMESYTMNTSRRNEEERICQLEGTTKESEKRARGIARERKGQRAVSNAPIYVGSSACPISWSNNVQNALRPFRVRDFMTMYAPCAIQRQYNTHTEREMKWRQREKMSLRRSQQDQNKWSYRL